MRAPGGGQEGFAAKGRGNDLTKGKSGPRAKLVQIAAGTVRGEAPKEPPLIHIAVAREPRPRITAHLGHNCLSGSGVI